VLGHDCFVRANKLREYTPLLCVRLAILSKIEFEELKEDRLSDRVQFFFFSIILNALAATNSRVRATQLHYYY